MATMVEDYTKTYTTFSGCDIVATFNGKVIGELQAITYSISREKAPIYTMGSAEPRSFSRGKRGIAGTLVFTVFNRDALIAEFQDKLSGENGTGVQKFVMNDRDQVMEATGREYVSIEDWDAQMSNLASNGSPDSIVTTGTTGATVSDLVVKTQAVYADEILPFDITITFANEYGQRAVLVIYGVEILNEGSGYSIDSVTTEKAYTYVARRIDYMRALDDNNDANISASY
jgi:hypothetical protein